MKVADNRSTMKIYLKVLFAALVGSFVYTLLSSVAGLNGLYAYEQLEKQKKEIAYKTNEIENINKELSLEYISLLKDKDVIASYARALGYIGDGETIVKVNGLKPYQKTLWDIGTATKRAPCKHISEETCKILGLVFFVLTFIMLLLFSGGVSKDGAKKIP